MPEPGQNESENLPSLTEESRVSRNDKNLPFTKESRDPRRALRQESRVHGRSAPFPESGQVLWEDEFGHLMFERSIKGYPKKRPYLELDSNYPEGFRVNGLMKSSFIPRIRKASDFMRSHGLPTERIIEVRGLERVPFLGEPITIEEWKRKVQEKWPMEFVLKEKETPGFLEQVKNTLENANFVVVERDLPLNERLADLNSLTSDSAIDFFKKIFFYYNQSQRHQPKQPQFKELSAEKPEDQTEYLTKILPTIMGRYLARFHSLGLHHHYPTDHNWTMAGCLVDLDSVRGKAIFENDPATTTDDIKLDLQITLTHLSFTVGKTGNTVFNSGGLGKTAITYFMAGYLTEYSSVQSLFGRLLGKGKKIEEIFKGMEITDPFIGFPIYSGERVLSEAKKIIQNSRK